MSADIEIDFVKVTRVDAGTRSRTLTVQIKGFGQTGDDTNAEGVEAVEFAQPLGLAANPQLSATTEAIIIRRGDEAIAVVILDKGGPVINVEQGGTQLYGAKETTAVVYIRAAGDVEVTPKAGRDAILSGGILKVARDSDPVNIGTLVGQAGPYPVIFTFVAAPSSDAGTGSASGPTVTLGGVIADRGGAAHVKA